MAKLVSDPTTMQVTPGQSSHPTSSLNQRRSGGPAATMPDERRIGETTP